MGHEYSNSGEHNGSLRGIQYPISFKFKLDKIDGFAAIFARSGSPLSNSLGTRSIAAKIQSLAVLMLSLASEGFPLDYSTSHPIIR